MPELPEVEITARRLSASLAGAEVESALAPGMVALKSVDPPLAALTGRRIGAVRRIGKMPVVDFDPPDGAARSQDGAGSAERLSLLVHLMSAGRLQVFDKRASLRDRTSRVLVRLADGRELRLREFGTKQRAWAKLLPAGERGRRRDGGHARARGLAGAAARGARRPDRPAPPPPPDAARPAGDRGHRPLLGRRDPLGGARCRRSSRDRTSTTRRSGRLHAALHVLGDAIDHYEQVIGERVPDKLPMPLQVHRRQGEPCPRCGATLAAVHFAEHLTSYCPEEQTGGRVLKDRRLSRLLK